MRPLDGGSGWLVGLGLVVVGTWARSGILQLLGLVLLCWMVAGLLVGELGGEPEER